VNGPVLVTGGSGFVGGELVRRLAADGVEVRGLARSPEAERRVAARGATAVAGDVLDEATVERAAAGCDVVFHVAGVNATCVRDPFPMIRANVAGAERVVRAAARAGARRVVLTSSAATIGERARELGTEASVHRGSFHSAYERSKWLGERRAKLAAQEAGVELVIVNPSSVQGPGRSNGTARLLITAMDGRVPAIVRTWVSIVDVGDCAAGHVLAAERGEDGERYLLNGASLPVGGLLHEIQRVTGRHRRVLVLPPAALRAAGVAGDLAGRLFRRGVPFCSEAARTLAQGHRYDGSRATRELGLAYTPLEETLRRTLAWYVDRGLVRPPRAAP